MTVKEAIASLKIDAENVGVDTDEDDMLPQAKRFIEAVKTVSDALESPRDWTPCADGLPEIMKRVIVTICGEIVIAEREHELDDDETTPIHWYDDEGCRFNDDVVTAWMMMPEPWTGGLDGK